MLGLLGGLLLSWLLSKWALGRGLAVLGWWPTPRRGLFLLAGLLLAGLCCGGYVALQTALRHSSWQVNPAFTSTLARQSSGWVARSVLTEELVFRGVLLAIALHKLRVRRACLLSAACFGVYHWFSYGAFGNPLQLALVFGMTGSWGYMFAMAYAKTGSLYLPVGLHLGWNLVHDVVFSRGPLGPQWLQAMDGEPLQGLASLLVFSLQVGALPLVVWGVLRYAAPDPLTAGTPFSTKANSPPYK